MVSTAVPVFFTPIPISRSACLSTTPFGAAPPAVPISIKILSVESIVDEPVYLHACPEEPSQLLGKSIKASPAAKPAVE